MLNVFPFFPVSEQIHYIIPDWEKKANVLYDPSVRINAIFREKTMLIKLIGTFQYICQFWFINIEKKIYISTAYN